MNLKFLIVAFLLLGSLVNIGTAYPKSQEPQKLYLEVYADFDYNTNATQVSETDSQLVTGQGSPVLTQGLKVEYNFFPGDPFNIQAKYDLFNNFYTANSLGFLDTLMHTWTVSPSFSFGSSRNIKFWMPFSFNYIDVGSHKYFTSFLLRPNLFHRFTKRMGYSVELRLARRYGWTPQTFPELYDYTSRDIGGSLGLYYFLDNGGYLQARLSYGYVGARGTNNSYSAYRLLVSGEYPIKPRLNVLVYLELSLRPYDNVYREYPFDILQIGKNLFVVTETFPKRYDKILVFGTIVEFKIYKGLLAAGHYYFTRWDSNIGLYDFTSHIIGGQLAYRY